MEGKEKKWQMVAQPLCCRFPANSLDAESHCCEFNGTPCVVLLSCWPCMLCEELRSARGWAGMFLSQVLLWVVCNVHDTHISQSS